jgi:hypothetical protein
MINLSRVTPVLLARRAMVLAGVFAVSSVIGAIVGIDATLLGGALVGVARFAVGFLRLGATTGIGVAFVKRWETGRPR